MFIARSSFAAGAGVRKLFPRFVGEVLEKVDVDLRGNDLSGKKHFILDK
jgi:hypothetical protein